MLLDTWFGPIRPEQPRHANGRFAHAQGSPAEVSLNETPADYGATGRDVLRYAAVQYGVRWASPAERQQVIDDYTAEFAVAAMASSVLHYVRHQNDAAHQRWCEDARRTDPELAKVLLHEDDPSFYMAVLSRPGILPAMVHFSAQHRDAGVARHAIRHDRISMHALLAVRDRYRRSAERARARHAAETWPPAQEHWAWLAERDSATAELAEQRLLVG